jgi:hypothetical protein
VLPGGLGVVGHALRVPAVSGRGQRRCKHIGEEVTDPKLRARLGDWQGMLGRQPEIARQILRKLLVGRLVLTPDATARTYTMQGRASSGRLLEGIAAAAGLVPPGRDARSPRHPG